MPIRERLTDVSRARRWDQELPLNYVYTLGVSGEKFVEGLKKGVLYASECTKCSTKYLPPKTYCTKCFAKIERYVETPKEGKIASITKTPQGGIYCYVTFEGIKGGLLHKLLKPAREDSKVVPDFLPTKGRKGRISDLRGFVPA